MARLLFSATMSLDGFIAGAGGDMSWLAEHLGANPEADGLVQEIGALLVGGRTFRGDDPNRGTEREGAFNGTYSGPSVVLTRTPAEPVPGVTFTSDLMAAIAAAKHAAGDKYVNVLGAQTAAACLAAGELDEVLCCIAPVMLGDGVRLFSHPGGSNVRLERVKVTESAGATNLWFRVMR